MSCPIISEAEIWKDFLINSMYCRATRKILPPPQLFRQFYSYSFLVFLNAIASPQPMKGAQFSEWIPAGKGIISPPTPRDLYWVSLTRLSWQPSFVIVPQLGASFRELPAVSQGPIHSSCMLEEKLPAAKDQHRSHHCRGGSQQPPRPSDATARVRAAKGPCEQSSTHRPDRLFMQSVEQS